MNKGRVNFDQFSRAIEKIGVAMNEYVSDLFNLLTNFVFHYRISKWSLTSMIFPVTTN